VENKNNSPLNIKSVAKTSGIKKFFENIRSGNTGLQLQKHQAARMSRRISVEQRRYAVGMEDTQSWQFETCYTTQELGMRIKYATKLSFCIMWLLYVQLLGRQKGCELVWADTINPPELSINDEARNDAHIPSTGVRLY